MKQPGKTSGHDTLSREWMETHVRQRTLCVLAGSVIVNSIISLWDIATLWTIIEETAGIVKLGWTG